jgi:hypothetical protein
VTVSAPQRDTAASPALPSNGHAKPTMLRADHLLGLNHARFVHEAYQLILGREPDGDGARHYLEILSTGTRTQEQILREMLQCEEFLLSGRTIEVVWPDPAPAMDKDPPPAVDKNPPPTKRSWRNPLFRRSA